MNKKVIFTVGALAIVAGAAFFLSGRSGGKGASDLPTFDVQRGNLVIEVVEGGNIHALDYLEIKNDVKITNGTKILEIIEEGYEVTDDDVKKGKVLAKLDPSGLEDMIVDHDVQFQETESSYAEAKQGLEIEESESLSEVKLVRQALRFALLDFQKFVGEKAAREVLQSLNLPYDNDSIALYEGEATEQILASFDANRLITEDAKNEGDEEPFKADTDDSQASGVDFGELLSGNRLGEGEAEQTMRRLKDEALVAKTELGVVEESVEGAKRLRERDFITKQTLENELVSLEKAKLALQTKETELDLFRDYEFPKEAEKMLSLYEEALLELIREKREAIASVARAEAKFRAAKRRYELELRKREDLQSQLASCTIVAERPGLVAYGGANEDYYTSRYYEAISQGATLKLGQPIITIPNMSRLGVDVDIHESHIKMIQLGQKAVINADAVADKTLEGRVTKVAVLPDSNASRYNPTLKVYPATIEIDGMNDFLKPGMTAKVKIIINELSDIIYIPIQAVFVEDDRHYVFVREGLGYTRLPVRIGDHNDEFIQIVEGLDEGEAVALRMPDSFETSDKEFDPARVASDRSEAKGNGKDDA
ncbi:MAG: efflux RND transporter periplasmic adaptor subunit [Verrucomicrobiae bacterium]|nr:efflux RND transporter periplasmic adaptor subunit [Verrucomicrobiae bacterium]MCP5538774.1 efflux RND transporter periplasmic adaptor subunit [Akkermansiaceae bacterium]MCP5549530.1 efflux RND transporter periplasmic adaptor subunit [Akkermansiaceae bacterium]